MWFHKCLWRGPVWRIGFITEHSYGFRSSASPALFSFFVLILWIILPFRFGHAHICSPSYVWNIFQWNCICDATLSLRFSWFAASCVMSPTVHLLSVRFRHRLRHRHFTLLFFFRCLHVDNFHVCHCLLRPPAIVVPCGPLRQRCMGGCWTGAWVHSSPWCMYSSTFLFSRWLYPVSTLLHRVRRPVHLALLFFAH